MSRYPSQFTCYVLKSDEEVLICLRRENGVGKSAATIVRTEDSAEECFLTTKLVFLKVCVGVCALIFLHS